MKINKTSPIPLKTEIKKAKLEPAIEVPDPSLKPEIKAVIAPMVRHEVEMAAHKEKPEPKVTFQPYMVQAFEDRLSYELRMATFPEYTSLDFPHFVDHFDWTKLLRAVLKRHPFQPPMRIRNPRLTYDYLIAETGKGNVFFLSKIFQINRYFMRSEAKKSIQRDIDRRFINMLRLEEQLMLRFLFDIKEKREIKAHAKFIAIIHLAQKRSAANTKLIRKMSKNHYKEKVRIYWNPLKFHIERPAIDSGSTRDGVKVARALMYGKSIGDILAMLARVKRNIRNVTLYQLAERNDGFGAISEIHPEQMYRITLPARAKKRINKKAMEKEVTDRDIRRDVHADWHKRSLKAVKKARHDEIEALEGFWQMLRKKNEVIPRVFDNRETNVASLDHKNQPHTTATILYELSIIRENNPRVNHTLEVKKDSGERWELFYQKRIKENLKTYRAPWEKMAQLRADLRKHCYEKFLKDTTPLHLVYDRHTQDTPKMLRKLQTEDPAVVLYQASEMLKDRLRLIDDAGHASGKAHQPKKAEDHEVRPRFATAPRSPEERAFDSAYIDESKDLEHKLVERNLFQEKLNELAKQRRQMQQKLVELPYSKEVPENIDERTNAAEARKLNADHLAHQIQHSAEKTAEERTLGLQEIRELMSRNKTGKG